ncbi:MAG: hypothetical protein PIR02_12460 [Microbacterium enclense]
MRALHHQILALLCLARTGLDGSASPNARTLAELSGRLVWLHELEDRSAAMPSLVAEAKRLDTRRVSHLAAMGADAELDPLLATLDVSMLGVVDSSIDNEARAFVAALKRTKGPALYEMWQEASQFTHATARLAIDWAPIENGGFSESKPSYDWTSVLHITSLYLCGITGSIVRDEGAELKDAMRFARAMRCRQRGTGLLL